jgi:hypothetical protein
MELLGAIVVALTVTACATSLTSDIDVDSQAAEGVDFSALNSYAWLATAQILNDPAGQWEPRGFDADAEIRFLIDKDLRTRGFAEVDSNPDVLVAYLAGIDMAALKLKKDPETKLEVLKNQPAGALAIVLVDATTGEPIWGAIATGKVKSEASDTDARKRLAYAVEKMIKRLPKS